MVKRRDEGSVKGKEIRMVKRSEEGSVKSGKELRDKDGEKER